MLILAIDPGAIGGMAWSNDGLCDCCTMPATDGEIIDKIRELTALTVERVCYCEKVGGFVKGRASPGSAMFNFGDGFGFLRGVLMAWGWRLIFVTPQVWQKPFALGKRSECATDGVWKNKLKAEAQRRFPGVAATLRTGDALLILDYGRAMERGKR